MNERTNEKIYRPKINYVDEVNKICNELKVAPADIINFFTETGIEVLNRALPIIKEDIKKEIQKKLLKY